MAGRMLRVALNAWKEKGRPKFDCRNFSSKGKIEPGFDFGRPMFGPHYGITNAPIQPDGTPLWVNWTKVRGAIGPAVDQGAFGTCYMCATLTGMQGVNFLATYDSTRQSIPLSMQHVYDCGTLTDGDMYYGGRPEDVLDFAIKNGGILAESVYPFKGKVGPCKFKQGLGVTIDGWRKVKPNSELALKYALAFGPVIVLVRFEFRMLVDGVLIQTRKYSRGTFKGPSYYSRPNHAVVLYGYGRDKHGLPTWDGINSWGPIWGKDGKFLIARGTDRAGGELGVLRNPIVPLKLNDRTRIVTSRCESCPRCFKRWNRSMD